MGIVLGNFHSMNILHGFSLSKTLTFTEISFIMGTL